MSDNELIAYKLDRLEKSKSKLLDKLIGSTQLFMRGLANDMAAKGMSGWLAMDSGGAVCWFSNRPSASEEGYWNEVGGVSCLVHVGYSSDVAKYVWQHSLTPVGGGSQLTIGSPLGSGGRLNTQEENHEQ